MAPFRIESIRLSQIGPFEDITITFPEKPAPGKAEIHLLTGSNGAGKTTVLEALALPFADDIQEKKHLRRVRNTHSSIEIIGTPFSSLVYKVQNGTFQWPGSTFILNNLQKRASQSTDLTRFDFAAFGYSGYRRADNVTITRIEETQETPLKGAADFTNSISPKLFLQWLVNIQSFELMSKGKGNIKKANQYRQSLSIIEDAISDIVGSPIRFDFEEDRFQARILMDGQSLNFDQLPDGLKSMVSWLGDLLMRMDRLKWENDTPILERNFLLFLDEIEVHLHPAWQRKILPVVQRLFPNAQVFVSTHSPFVVGSVDGAWVHRFEKNAGYSTQVEGWPRLSEDAYSYDYILEEIFGVKERFGVKIERDLAEFQTIKQKLLAGNDTTNRARFTELIQSLSGQSIELDNILGMELKQLNRLMPNSFSL